FAAGRPPGRERAPGERGATRAGGGARPCHRRAACRGGRPARRPAPPPTRLPRRPPAGRAGGPDLAGHGPPARRPRLPAPSPPRIPPEPAAPPHTDPRPLAERLPPADDGLARLPSLPHVDLLPLPALPRPALPLPELPALRLPGLVDLEETSVTGAPRRLNPFDQNVPGFSITFLLLGVLLGVPLGFLDERDWGTLARLRTTPTPLATVVLAKLTARFTIGLAQMLVLLAVGRAAFGVSLGPTPWALLLPTTGIVFAGTAFGLVV